MKRNLFALIASALIASNILAQPPSPTPTPDPQGSIARKIQAKAVVAAATVPYCVDLAWQVPLGSRLGWVTTSVANPDPALSPAHVFLVRGTGTVFSPGYGALCGKLRRAGIWTEDLGPHGDHWACRHVISEQRAGRWLGAVVLVGHSRGGRHVLDAAHELQKAGIAVDLLVCLDVALPQTVPGNVRQALNIYMSEWRVYPADMLQAERGSQTRIENIDLSKTTAPISGQGLHHLNITASNAVQNLIIERILNAASSAPRSASRGP